MLDKKTLTQIHDYFSRQKDVAAAYLYGSRATGKNRPQSDVDIAVVFNQPQKSYRRQFKIATELGQRLPGIFLDVREINFSNSPVFLMSVLKNGKLVFSRNETRRCRFEVAVMQNYIDTQKLRDIQYNYFQQRLRR